MSCETNSTTSRVEPAASKVAPAAREDRPPGSADPAVASGCAVDAESRAASLATKSGERSQGCSPAVATPFFAAGEALSLALPLRRVRSPDSFLWREPFV